MPTPRTRHTLREQVATVEETHLFSRDSVEHGAARLLAGRLLLHRRADAGHTGRKPPWVDFRAPHPALSVVGGNAGSNPAAQLGLAGSNNGSNLPIARNLFHVEDRVSKTVGRHQITAGLWVQQLRSNETIALSQFGQATFTSLLTFPARARLRLFSSIPRQPK